LCAISDITSRQDQPNGIAQRIAQNMKFGGQSTTRAANSFRLLLPSLFKPGTGFFAPALCWCARTMVASIMTNSKSGSSAKALKRLSQTPLSDQRLYRWKTLFHFPKLSGSSRQWLPVRAIQSTASTNFRLSAAVLPASLFLPGNRSLIRCH
jgi:hypothetical protein